MKGPESYFEHLDERVKKIISGLSSVLDAALVVLYIAQKQHESLTLDEILKCLVSARTSAKKDSLRKALSRAGKNLHLVGTPRQRAYKIMMPGQNRAEKILSSGDIPKQKVAKSLRDLLKKIEEDDQKNFLNEAIICFEIDAKRSAMIMTWLLCIDTLYEHVLNKELEGFNSVLKNRTEKQYKKIEIKKKSDFESIKEFDFIEMLYSLGSVSLTDRKILRKRLDDRNSYAHPSSIVITESTATAFIEDLVENIIVKFQ